MRLDRTAIVIRDRSWGETLDLALPVIRRHAAPLLGALVAGALPLAIVNHLALMGRLDAIELRDEFPWGFVFWQALLTAIEIPLATAFITLYLGQSMFLVEARPRVILREFVGSLPQLFWFQVIVRGSLGVLEIGWIVPYCWWPFLNEVILLERHPGWPRKQPNRPKTKSTFRRGLELHAGFGGEFLGIWLGSMALGVAMILSLCFSVLFLREMLGGSAEFDWWMLAVVLPAAEWLTVGYFAVVRYLTYLNLRIRNEGWEVEIKLRAERARLVEQPL